MEYILVTFPDSQYLMDKSWFKECILMNDVDHLQDIGSSAYFVPKNRYNELTSNTSIKLCPNCKEEWLSYECCGFDASEVDI